MNEDERLAKLREAYETALLKPAQARSDQANEEYALTPKLNDSVTDMAFDANGRPNPKDAVRIQKMEDERGNVIYLSYPIGQPTRTSLEDLRALSLRILDQRTAFEQLDPKVSSTLSEADKEPFKDHLQNRALGERFAELKTNSPHPSSK